MKPLSKTRSLAYHLYPGILVTGCYLLLAQVSKRYAIPSQAGLLAAIGFVAMPVLLLHLAHTKRHEKRKSLREVNLYTAKISRTRLVLYTAGLVTFAFLAWGVMTPVAQFINERFLGWLPSWYSVQDLSGTGSTILLVCLAANLVLNGVLAPVLEEYYFRGYLLSRMTAWGNRAFLVNTICFTLYHFWQPAIWCTLMIALLPMTYLVWKTRDLRIGLYTHMTINIIGALLTFGQALQ